VLRGLDIIADVVNNRHWDRPEFRTRELVT